DGPGARTRARVEQRRPVVLLDLGRRGGVAVPTDRFPGSLVELIFAAVAAVRGDDARVAPRLAGGDRFEGPDRDAAGEIGVLLMQGAAHRRVVLDLDPMPDRVREVAELLDR